MPKRKPTSKPPAVSNPAVDAHKPKAPAVELPAIPVVELAPASKPPVDTPVPPPVAADEEPRLHPYVVHPPRMPQPPAATAAPAPASGDALTDQQIEAKLKDPSFDPSGVERLRLAKLLQRR